jgi:hypothetical protein
MCDLVKAYAGRVRLKLADFGAHARAFCGAYWQV